MAHTQAVGVDTRRRRLRTTRGTITYGELILAHGAQARTCSGLPDELTWRVNDLSAYRRLREALSELSLREGRSTGQPAGTSGPTVQPPSVLLVGAGLVGCELANDLALAGYPVTLIETAERPLPMATVEQSQALLDAWSSLPIRFLGGQQVQQASREATGRIRLELQGGMVLNGDILVSAVGLSTPSRLAAQAGLTWNNGVSVDAQTLSTGVDHVHALGDCISIEGKAHRFIEPIRRQASLVAARVCGAAIPAYDAACPPIRVKTSSLPLTLLSTSCRAGTCPTAPR